MDEYIKKARILIEKTKRAVKYFLKFIQHSFLLFASPVTWCLFLGIVLLFAFVAAMFTWGPKIFKEEAKLLEPPNVNLVTQDKREMGVAIYFATNGVDPKVASHLAQISSEKPFSYGTVNGQEIKNCGTDCLLDKIEKGEIKEDDLKLGTYEVSGKLAKDMLIGAKVRGLEWTDSRVQLEFVATSLVLGGTTSDINKARENIGLPRLPDSVRKEYENKAEKVYKQHETKLKKTKKSIGDGKGRSRLQGGGSSASIDTSSLVAFLESFTLPYVHKTTGRDGSSEATQEMIDAKDLAQSNGGRDPAPNLYSSCDRLVATALKGTNLDVHYPWGAVRHQLAYVLSNPNKYVEVTEELAESGDIVFWVDNGNSHTAILGEHEGKMMIYQASYYDYLPNKMVAFNGGNGDPNGGGQNTRRFRLVN